MSCQHGSHGVNLPMVFQVSAMFAPRDTCHVTDGPRGLTDVHSVTGTRCVRAEARSPLGCQEMTYAGGSATAGCRDCPSGAAADVEPGPEVCLADGGRGHRGPPAPQALRGSERPGSIESRM